LLRLNHLRQHGRFYGAAAVGVLVFLACWRLPLELRAILAGDVFFALYLALTAPIIGTSTPEQLRRNAAPEDEDGPVIVALTIGAVAFSVVAIFALVQASGDAAWPRGIRIALAAISIVLAWTVLHVVFAVHYAHLYYGDADEDPDTRRDRGGLIFPGDGEPDLWDFLYFSSVIGTTAQVSDVQVQAPHMRRRVLVHGVVSFFFNTVILALAINTAVSG
jgi:uncharacterized membrane protein